MSADRRIAVHEPGEEREYSHLCALQVDRMCMWSRSWCMEHKPGRCRLAGTDRPVSSAEASGTIAEQLTYFDTAFVTSITRPLDLDVSHYPQPRPQTQPFRLPTIEVKSNSL